MIRFYCLLFFAEKKPKPENIDIYTLKISSDRRCKVIKLTLADVWKQGCIIKINNFGDKEKAPHSEKDIKNQVCLFTSRNVRAWLAQKYFLWFLKNFFRLPFDLFAAQFLHNCLQFSHIFFSFVCSFVCVQCLQISFGTKAKQMLWHDSQHFAMWCRYGDRQQDIRRRQVDETQNYFFSY